MRIRVSFAVAFIALIILATFLVLGDVQVPHVNAKLLHLVAFFLLALAFYWVFDTTRRRALNLTLLVVTTILGLGAELLRIFLTGRPFDLIDIAANFVGSLSAIGLCTAYHKRMLDRKRRARYGLVPQEVREETLEIGTQDTELGALDEGEDSTDGEGRMTPGSEGDDGSGKK